MLEMMIIIATLLDTDLNVSSGSYVDFGFLAILPCKSQRLAKRCPKAGKTFTEQFLGF